MSQKEQDYYLKNLLITREIEERDNIESSGLIRSALYAVIAFPIIYMLIWAAFALAYGG